MPVDAFWRLLGGALLGIPAWVASMGAAVVGVVTQRPGWTYAAALLALGPLLYFAATPRFQYVAPAGMAVEIAAMVVLRRRGDIRLATVLAVLPLLVILLGVGRHLGL